MAKVVEGTVDATGMRLGIAVARFNDHVTGPLLEGAVDKIRRSGGSEDAVEVVWVPGAFELPLACKWLAESGRFDGVLALGAVIRGQTPHFDYVCEAATRGVLRVQLDTGVPVAFGVLTCETVAQARARSGPGADNKGCEAAEAAIAMVRAGRKIHG